MIENKNPINQPAIEANNVATKLVGWKKMILIRK